MIEKSPGVAARPYPSLSCERGDGGDTASRPATWGYAWQAWLLTSRLSGLAANLLADIPNALALVRLGWTQAAKLGGHLANDRLVGAVDHDLRRLRRGQLDSRRRLVLHRVGETKSELQPVRPHFGLVADAGDLELLLIALGHAFDHVEEQGPRESVQRLVVLLIGDAADFQRAVIFRDADTVGKGARKLALGTFHLHRVALDRHGHTVRDGNRQFS